jgi:hypothetical protein
MNVDLEQPEIKKLKLDTQKLETVESEIRKANKSMAYFKKQNSEYREINQNQKQVILLYVFLIQLSPVFVCLVLVSLFLLFVH